MRSADKTEIRDKFEMFAIPFFQSLPAVEPLSAGHVAERKSEELVNVEDPAFHP